MSAYDFYFVANETVKALKAHRALFESCTFLLIHLWHSDGRFLLGNLITNRYKSSCKFTNQFGLISIALRSRAKFIFLAFCNLHYKYRETSRGPPVSEREPTSAVKSRSNKHHSSESHNCEKKTILKYRMETDKKTIFIYFQ